MSFVTPPGHDSPRPAGGEEILLIKDKQPQDQYEDFIQKSLTYVVSCVKFLSYSQGGDKLIKPHYLPYEHVAGFNKNYDDQIGQVARMVSMSKDNQHLYVRARIANGLSLKPIDAYREIYDGNDKQGFSHVIFPVHSQLTAHFKPENEQFYHPLDSLVNARAFCERAHNQEAPSIESKCRHMIFYAETFASHVHSKHKKHGDLRGFYQAVEENCEAVKAATGAYRTLATTLEKYIKH